MTSGEAGADFPLVSVVMATRDRPRLLSVTLECYRRQTYARRELVVVDDGDRDPVDPATVAAAGGRLLRVPSGTPLGAKLNLGIEATSGPLCQKIDDDGWYATGFLETMVSALLESWKSVYRPTLAYLAPFLVFDLARWEVRRTGEAHVAGGTLLFQRSNWRERPFRPLQIDEDDSFLRDHYDLGVIGLAVRSIESYLAVDGGEVGSGPAHARQRQPGLASVDEDVPGQELYGLGLPEAIVPEWTLRVYRELHRERCAATAAPEAAPAALPEASVESPAKVLILTPLKDASRFIDGYCELLRDLTYPHAAISLGFLEGDSADDTYELIQRHRPALGAAFRRVGLWKRDFGYRPPPGLHRGAAPIQIERRAVLARSRNHLLLHALDDEDWVLWLDVDVVEYPEDLIEQLLAAGRDIVQPHCVLEFGGPTFDLNGWRDRGRLHLDDLRGEGELVELDAVGATVLLVRADLHRDGLVFPPFLYGRESPWMRPRRGEVETEGFGIMARDMGHRAWGMPNFEVLRADERGATIPAQPALSPLATSPPSPPRLPPSPPRLPPSPPASPWAEWHRRQDEALEAVGEYPTERFADRGIVIVAGGPRYFTCAWVALTILRRELDCRLPIQVWYLGPDEMSAEMLSLLERFEVECIDALEVRGRHPVRILGGWQCKPYAILHSRFREVLLLDADNIPLVDPSFLFETPEYRRTGAVFWADKTAYPTDSPIWEICRLPYRPGPELESGQVMVDKARCWRALQLTMHLNEWSEFYYRFVHGDKNTFDLAWRMVGQDYSMPAHPPGSVFARHHEDEVFNEMFEQHDFDGRVIFHHRSGGAKWIAQGDNIAVPSFLYERACRAALDELREVWDGRLSAPPAHIPAVYSADDFIRQRFFLYHRVSADQRTLELLDDGTIGRGRAAAEERWRLEPGQADAVLVLSGQEGDTCRLSRDPDGIWRGRWLRYERMPIELIPLGQVPAGLAYTPA